MPPLVALAAATLAAINLPFAGAAAGTATNQHRAEWRVLRTEYVEFCDANIAVIDVANGSLHGSIGSCDPHRNVPTKQVEARVDEDDIAALRNKLSNLKATALTDHACAAAQRSVAQMPIALSGPITLTIERNGERVSVNAQSPCLTEAGRSLIKLVDRTIEPLRSLGLR